MLPSRDIVKVQSCLSTENSPCQDNRQGLARPGARPCPGGLWATPKTRRPPCSFFRAVPKTRRPPYPVSRAVPKTRRPPYPVSRAALRKRRPPYPVSRAVLRKRRPVRTEKRPERHLNLRFLVGKNVKGPLFHLPIMHVSRKLNNLVSNTASKLGPHTQKDQGTCPGGGL